ncbi:MAG: histidine decarboxylase [Cyanobacteriota bacterium]
MITLDEFRRQLAQRTEFHAGYPYNLDYDYTPLLPFLQYTLNNLGDPYVASNYGIDSREFEQACLKWFAQLYELDDHWGYVNSCGTEGNLYGIFLGRELYPDGIVYSSRDTHYSIAKASRLFRIPHVIVESQDNGELNYEHLELSLRQNRHHPAIININLGTTLKGATDRVDRVLDLLEQLNIDQFHIHCDGALGGLLLPFIEDAPKISFQQPIGSIAVSGHKFIGSPIPCGVVLTRREYVRKIEQDIEYIGSKDTTIMGSRCGLAPLFLWYAIATRGEHFREEVKACVNNAHYLYNCLGKIDYSAMLNDFSTTVVLQKPDAEVCRKWQLATQGELAHLVVMQNITVDKIDLFMNDLRASLTRNISNESANHLIQLPLKLSA